MNDRYVGDIGDFSKLGLLRHLVEAGRAEGRRLKLGLLWYATTDAGGAAGDGRHRDYLDGKRREAFRRLDPELHRAMQPFAQARRFRIADLERVTREVLPGVAFHGAPLDFQPRSSSEERRAFRDGWAAEAAKVARRCDLVCVDPDNGLASGVASRTSKQARKLIFDDELPRLVGPEQSLVLYHHQTRIGDARTQARQLRARIGRLLPSHHPPRVLRFTAYSSRFYVVVAARAHRFLAERAVPELARAWDPHFAEVV